MKQLVIICMSLLGIACQPLYIKTGHIETREAVAVPVQNSYGSVLGSWKNNHDNLYITFNSFDEYFVTRYISTRSSYGHRVVATGYYEITDNRLYLTDLNSGQIDFYYLQQFDGHVFLEPGKGRSSDPFMGEWYPAPLIDDFYPRPRPVPAYPVQPIPGPIAEPVVVVKPSKPGKKRPQPVLERPERPEKEKSPEEAEIVKSRPQRPQTR